MSDTELAERAGLDALAYITLFKTGLKIFGASLLYCIIIELPVNVTGNYYTDYNKQPGVLGDPNRELQFTNFDKMSMGNVKKGSSRLWTHVIAAYWVAFVCYYILYTSYKNMSHMRAQFLSSFGARATVRQYAVLVTDIPASEKADRHSQVDSFFHKLHPGTFERAQVITKLTKVDKKYKEKEKVRRKLAHAEAAYAEAQKKNTEKAKRPQHKTGFLGLVGEKVDTIDWCQKRLAELGPELAEERRKTVAERTIDAALVFFNSRAIATMSAQSAHARKAESWQTQFAPEPRDVIWANLGVSWWEKFARQSLVYGATFLIIFFYLIPITIVSGFSTLDNLKKFASFLNPVFDIGPVKAILQAFLPQLALLVFLAILPKLLLFLTKREGVTSLSHADRGCAGKYYYFMVFNVFLGVTVAGSAFGQLKQMTENPTGIVDLLGSSIPQQATFFITYIALSGFVGYGLALSQLIRVVIYLVKLKFLVKTEEEKRDSWAPGSFSYGSTVPKDLLIVLLGLCYAVIAPIIIPFCIVYLGLGYIINKNLALEVKVPEYESGGRMYPHIHKRFVASLFIAQLTLLGFMGIMKFTATPVMIPLPILTVVFHLFTKKCLEPRFTSTAIEVAIQEVSEEPSIQEVMAAYTPECMAGENEDVESSFSPAKASSREHETALLNGGNRKVV
ncbi:early-responsive to dehydration stress protein [Klebsormidium nitens]|uniref:Early-responsive to dehydration stress protein n=1 Tax=Klebsormidium nitens TaxID=105231 RepID=A0A1Y1INJ6_KLENI|nr:early-responsive to dehydration stress protein [Klebsormidium nitens]|eukprot:GAQ89688.1 early-responsive to dehydration stress protein [Klebsormidium nitens]